MQKFLKREAQKLKQPIHIIPNGQFRDDAQQQQQHFRDDPAHAQHCSSGSSNHDTLSPHKHHHHNNQATTKRTNFKTSPTKDVTESKPNVPLVCKAGSPVKRIVHVKPDHDIKVDINANADIHDDKPSIVNGDLEIQGPLNTNGNNNNVEVVENVNGDDTADSTPPQEDISVVKERAVRNSSRKTNKAKKATRVN